MYTQTKVTCSLVLPCYGKYKLIKVSTVYASAFLCLYMYHLYTRIPFLFIINMLLTQKQHQTIKHT